MKLARQFSGGRRTGFLALIAVMLASAACASTPTGPSVLVLPGTGKSHDQFRVEDAQCRERAARELHTTERGTVSDQNRYNMVYVQCMYAQGNQVPVPGHGWRSPTSEATPAARPPGVPPPPEGVPPSPPPATPR